MGLSDVKHSEGSELRQMANTVLNSWLWRLALFRLLQQIGWFPAITLEYLPKWVAQSAEHKKNEKQLFYIYIFIILIKHM